MDDTSIGEMLRSKREARSLGLQEVHEATKITTQNLAALEENHFDAFPNKVYARAFLRDYANFLDLDSASLLARYEEQWGGGREVEPVRPASRSAWPRIGYALILIAILGGASAGSYFWFVGWEQRARSPRVERRRETPPDKDRSITPPEQPSVGTVRPQPLPEKPKPLPPPPPVASDKITLDVAALRNVWVRIKCDGRTEYEAIMPKGSAKHFEAKQAIDIRAGMAGAVQIKFNGIPQKPLGTLKTPGQKVFRREKPAAGSPALPPPASWR